jgi:PAS domain-containing protein
VSISGLSFQEALGMVGLMQYDDDKAAIINGWQNETTINKKLMSEYRFMRPDGKIAWVMGQSIPEVNSENQIVGYVGTDITERKQAEDQF